ncbi:MAG: hypothetical protein JO352_01760 [Chloroflexi bacterium]|nr:hypothetical protein [Chloroflexota bacterium]
MLGGAIDAAEPQLLVLIELATPDAQPLEIGADDPAPPDALFGNQASQLENGDVLLDAAKLIGQWLASSTMPSSAVIARRDVDFASPRSTSL